MLKISTKSQYGLRAMVYLAKYKDRICSIKSISEEEGISFDYLEKIVSQLEKAGFLKAKKGAQGGYFLAKTPERIKIGEIVLALEGRGGLVRCLNKEKEYFCPLKKKCLAKNFWFKIQKSLNSAFNSITLADLVKK